MKYENRNAKNNIECIVQRGGSISLADAITNGRGLSDKPCVSCGDGQYHMHRDYHHIVSLSDMFILYLCRWESQVLSDNTTRYNYITTQVDTFDNIRIELEGRYCEFGDIELLITSCRARSSTLLW